MTIKMVINITKTRQEIYCHGCQSYIQFEIDLDLNGNHILKCPKCAHEHCRVVRNGEITEDRWGVRRGLQYWGSYNITASGISTTSAYFTSTGGTSSASNGSSFLSQSWADSTGSSF